VLASLSNLVSICRLKSSQKIKTPKSPEICIELYGSQPLWAIDPLWNEELWGVKLELAACPLTIRDFYITWADFVLEKPLWEEGCKTHQIKEVKSSISSDWGGFSPKSFAHKKCLSRDLYKLNAFCALNCGSWHENDRRLDGFICCQKGNVRRQITVSTNRPEKWGVGRGFSLPNNRSKSWFHWGGLKAVFACANIWHASAKEFRIICRWNFYSQKSIYEFFLFHQKKEEKTKALYQP